MASAIIKGCGMYIGEKELIFEIKEEENPVSMHYFLQIQRYSALMEIRDMKHP